MYQEFYELKKQDKDQGMLQQFSEERIGLWKPIKPKCVIKKIKYSFNKMIF